MKHPKILAMVMAGGRGERLFPLTRERSKPAVPLGGKYRLIDFVLSNLVNSGICGIYVLTQYKSHSLNKHLQEGWHVMDVRGTDFIVPVPAQMWTDGSWYKGTADAIYQNLHLLDDHDRELVAVFGADHVYRMNVRQMVDFHLEHDAEATVATIPVPVDRAKGLGVVAVDSEGRIEGFLEKPEAPPEMPDRPGWVLASMGNYLFRAELLRSVLVADADKATAHDFGKTIFPDIFQRNRVFAYDFSKNEVPGQSDERERGYWRDVGRIGDYYDTNMDFRRTTPVFDLYNKKWPLRTAHYDDPPVKTVFDDDGRRGEAHDSVVSEGTIISGGRVERSVLGRRVFVHSFSLVQEAILMDNVDIGRKAQVRRAILDKDVRIGEGVKIGFDPEADAKRFHIDADSGIVVIPKGVVVSA